MSTRDSEPTVWLGLARRPWRDVCLGPMRLGTTRAGFAAALCAAVVTLGAAGCGSGDDLKSSDVPASQTPQPCASEPLGHAQDGVNDEQGGSTPGIDPCDGPGT